MNYKETDILNIVIAGTAGQGVITLKRLIEFAAQKANADLILGSEMHGLAQREGAITSHTRYQKKAFDDPRKNLQSPLICYGDADLYICLEPVEALRRGIFSSDKTTFVLNERTIPGVMITADLEEYPSLGRIGKILKANAESVFFMNATQLALDNFNDNQQLNIVMLGFAIATGKLPFIEMEHYEEVIKEWLRDPDMNIEALHLGLEKGKVIISKSN
ncbi:MAG: Indolepyruvate oxidoreductase subunit IorB (modular protein) [Promethearchaeota archaeon]|nr:MAG: Indolepyruvate oxidoreductase subunit IorB (modular protein) [Candidatus Lokiarchaeota archaeon]